MSPRLTPPVFTAAPKPAMTPQPIRPAASGRAAGSTLTAWPAATSVFSAKAPIPSAGDRGVPSARVIGWVAFRLSKQYQGRPRRHERHVPARRPPGHDHVVAGRHVGHPLPDRFDHAGRLVAEQEGKVVVDRPLAVVEVGVADPARPATADQYLARARVRAP